MRKVFDVRGYATLKTCTNLTEKKLAKMGLEREVRWIPSVTEQGRIVPVAVSYPSHAMAALVHNGVCVV